MPTYRIDLCYDGSGYHGYARQADVRTIQAELESALAKIAQTSVRTTVAGRTDRGVHAVGQVVSFDHPEPLDTQRVARSLNSLLGPEIAITEFEEAPAGFNARKDAVTRTYRYEILNAPVSNPFRRHDTWHVHQRLDLESMNEAAGLFLGEQDFSAFCRDDEGKSRHRHVVSAVWSRSGDIVAFDIEANAFCHQMVRSLVAICVEVGKGNRTTSQVAEIMAGGDRNDSAGAAPPTGLRLMSVNYDGDRWHP